MSQHLVLTAIGPDRPGLVDEVSQFIFERGGNIADSRMANLGGQFVMMVLVGGGVQTLADVGRDLAILSGHSGLTVQAHPAALHHAAASAMPYRMTATAMDRAGLVHRIAHVLRSMNVNIESLATNLRPAPITGAPMFEMELTMSVPSDTAIGALRQQVGRLCDELNVDWQMAAL